MFKSQDANLDDTEIPPPSFSIRDYVFSSRNKDITCNWPFSHKSLQLCLQYGVENLLPPFESLDLLRHNSSVSKHTVENHLPNEEIVNGFHKKPTSHPFGSIPSCGTKSHKTENIKLNSETMASKVCPVCKTFLSPSYTTLNAHIDQCLSGESSMKLTTNPKTMVKVKHRIKPRKTRLMTDTYKTAPYSSVEELDKRNCTSWATNSSFLDQDLDFHGASEVRSCIEENVAIEESCNDKKSMKAQVDMQMDDSSCCCSRKDGVSSQTVRSHYQESALLRKRAIESKRRPSNMNFRPKLFSQINHSTSLAPETVKSSRDMVNSEELEGNSSLTMMSRAHSSQDSMSDSPISTISNPSLAKTIDVKKGSSSRTVASNYQESALLRKRAIESKRRSSNMNFRPKLFSLVNTYDDVSSTQQLKPPSHGSSTSS